MEKPTPKIYGVIGCDGVVTAYPAKEINDYISHLEKRAEAAEHERDCHMDIAEHFKARCKELEKRAEAAEEKLQTKEQELAQYVECFEAEAARADRNHAKLAELVPQCLVYAMSNLNLEGVSIGDKAIIAKSIEVLRNIEEAE